MRNRYLLPGALVLGALVAAGVVAGDASLGPGDAIRWDYGILEVDTLTWREPGRIVEQRTGPKFAAALNVRYSNQSDVLEINLLNGLGRQGWELVAVSQGTVYVFKRPR